MEKTDFYFFLDIVIAMNWFFIALIGPILWSVVNHIDKYVITKYFRGPGVGSLVIFSSLSGLIISFFILVFGFSFIFIAPISAVIIAINGVLLVSAFIPYFYALENGEASWVSSLYQLIPVFGYVLGLIFLHEQLTIHQLLASLLVISGAIIISLDLSQKITLKIRPLLLIMLSSLMIAVNSLIFKIIAIDETFWGTAFWEYIGGGLFGILLFAFNPLYKEQFLATIQRGRKVVLSINLVSELLNIGAKLAVNFATLLAPLALVWVVNGFQPLIVFLYGVILTLFLPSLGKENISKEIVFQKLSAIAFMFVGIYLLFR